MVDYVHMHNVIQGAVIQIVERRPLEKQYDALGALERFLREQAETVLIEKMKVREREEARDDEYSRNADSANREAQEEGR